MLFVLVTVAGCSNGTSADITVEISKLENENKQLKEEIEVLKNMLEEQDSEVVSSEEVNVEGDLILPKEIAQYPQSIYKMEKLDIDGDGEEELIELYVNAAQHDNGVFMWDDGQNWMLVVTDGETTYPLFDKFVQLGGVDFSTGMIDGKPGIVMVENWPMYSSIELFTFHSEQDAFVKETIFQKENILEHYNQPTSYALFEDAYELIEEAFTEKIKVALEVSVDDLEEYSDRIEVLDPVLINLYQANALLYAILELNPQIFISLEDTIKYLNQMVMEQPSDSQLMQLRELHELFLETKGDEEVILKDENQINTTIRVKLTKMETILQGSN